MFQAKKKKPQTHEMLETVFGNEALSQACPSIV
jgi:hypothetical protein